MVLKWFGYADSNQFRDACYQSLILLTTMKTSRMIADNTDGRVVSMDDQKWMLENWFPQAYESGYRTSAVVISKNFFRELAIDNIVNQLDKGKFTVHYFDDFEKAKEWMKNQD